jgi:hypothetical protein
MARYEELRKAVVRRSNRWPESFVLPTTALQSLFPPVIYNDLNHEEKA